MITQFRYGNWGYKIGKVVEWLYVVAQYFELSKRKWQYLIPPVSALPDIKFALLFQRLPLIQCKYLLSVVIDLFKATGYICQANLNIGIQK